MTTRGKERKFNGRQSYPFPVWSGLLEHRDRIKTAIWTYLWLLNRITTEKDGLGMVNYGNPVRLGDIATEISSDEKTIRIHLEILVKGGYINLRRARYGILVEVCNSSKFGIWSPHWRAGKTPDLTGRNARPDRKKCPTSNREKDLQAVEQAVVTKSENAPMQHSYAANPLYEKEGFSEFWKKYPRGDAKKKAAKAWAKLDAADHVLVMASLGPWKQSRQWQKDGGQYIPYAATFLNEERWKETSTEMQRQETAQSEEREMVRAKVPA